MTTPPLTASQPTSLRVLVVDDDDDLRTLVRDLLERIGHQVRLAADGHSALAAVAEFQPDVVLLDLQLPDMTGYRVAEELRAAHGSRVVIAAITGWALPHHLVSAREAGFDHFLAKPIGVESLRELVGSARPSAPPPASPRSLSPLIAAANRACASADAEGLASAVRDMLPVLPDELAIDLVSIIELSRYDVELAQLRWANLRDLLRKRPRSAAA
jgi:CheY-like chemotaxis protein